MSNITEENDSVFKICPMCKTTWTTMDSFLADPHLMFNGYQASFGQLDQGIFFFTHNAGNCGSTMGIKVKTFATLYSGPRYTINKQLSEDCPLYCLDHSKLNRCNAQCENAFAREISQIIKERQAYLAIAPVNLTRETSQTKTLTLR